MRRFVERIIEFAIIGIIRGFVGLAVDTLVSAITNRGTKE